MLKVFFLLQRRHLLVRLLNSGHNSLFWLKWVSLVYLYNQIFIDSVSVLGSGACQKHIAELSVAIQLNLGESIHFVASDVQGLTAIAASTVTTIGMKTLNNMSYKRWYSKDSTVRSHCLHDITCLSWYNLNAPARYEPDARVKVLNYSHIRSHKRC